jgi:hypothetical protein
VIDLEPDTDVEPPSQPVVETGVAEAPAVQASPPPAMPDAGDEVIDLESDTDVEPPSQPVAESGVPEPPAVQASPPPAVPDAGDEVIDLESDMDVEPPPEPVIEAIVPDVPAVTSLDAAPAGAEEEPGPASRDQTPADTTPPATEPEAAGAEGDFFDLAGAIERELAEEESQESRIPVVDDSEEAVDTMTGIRRAIQDQVGAEDHQTHYQLGIAFKGMGMLDEAIGEFQQASRNPESFASCFSMLGLCFREKNMPQIAERWYARGLEQGSAGPSDGEERLGLLYDMGELYVATGQTGKAQECFLEVYAASAHYRDVAARLREIGEVQEGDPPPRAGR